MTLTRALPSSPHFPVNPIRLTHLAALVGLTFLLSLAACSSSQNATVFDLFDPCASDEGPVDALCGTVEVFEDREAASGRKIDLKVVILPALSNDPRPDPLFVLVGGPGAGAAENARSFQRGMESIQTDRDIVLVDQRGTGDSNPLDCELPEGDLEDLSKVNEAYLEEFQACLENYDADPRLYTTSIAMDDLDDVREFVGYEKINLYGGSYGTRAGLVYMVRHPDHVRAVVLDGVAPPDMMMPISAALDGQRALDLFLDDCEADAVCNKRFPHLRERLERLLARIENNPPKVRMQHPRTGEWADVEIHRELVTNTLFSAFYSPLSSSLLPLLIERAEKDDFQPMVAMTFAGEGLADLMSHGMFLSVICSEDVPRVTDKDREKVQESFLGDVLENRLQPCEFWPRGEVSEDYYKPVESDAPALILSGNLDPITPPRWGEHIAEGLPNATHLVVPGVGHGAMGRGCVSRLVKQFLDEGSAKNLDTSCIEDLRRPPFFVSPTGPKPDGKP